MPCEIIGKCSICNGFVTREWRSESRPSDPACDDCGAEGKWPIIKMKKVEENNKENDG